MVSVEKTGMIYKVRIPYDVDTIAELKSRIPYQYRKWDRVQKCWIVGDSYRGALFDLLREKFGWTSDDDVVVPKVQERQSGTPGASEWSQLMIAKNHLEEDKRNLRRERDVFEASKRDFDKLRQAFYEERKRASAQQARPQWTSSGGSSTVFAPFSGLPKTKDEAARVLGVASNAPIDSIKAVQKVMARSCHPDLGGSVDKMQAVNVAVDILLKGRI